MQNPKKYIRIIISIVFIIFINKIDFGINKRYFQSDIDFFQNSIDVYSKYTVGLFLLIYFMFLIFRNRNEIKPNNPNIISPEFLKHTPLIIFIAIIIYINFDKTVTDCCLIVNKQKQISSVEKKFKIYSYDEKKEELILIVNNLEYYKLKKSIYKSLENKEKIKLKFKIGLLGIPYDPEYKK